MSLGHSVVMFLCRNAYTAIPQTSFHSSLDFLARYVGWSNEKRRLCSKLIKLVVENCVMILPSELVRQLLGVPMVSTGSFICYLPSILIHFIVR